MQCPKCGFEKSGRSCLRCIRNMQQIDRARFLQSLKVGMDKVGATTTGSTKIDTLIADNGSKKKSVPRKKTQKLAIVQVNYEVYILGKTRRTQPYVYKTRKEAEQRCDELIAGGWHFMLQRTEVLVYNRRAQAALASLNQSGV